MRKLLILLFPLLFTGCSLFTTPEVVYKDLSLIKENVLIQKRITDTLLEAVKPQNDRQVEALALKKLDVEQRFDRMASGLNRLVTYFKAEKEVGYLINVLDFMKESRLKGLLLSADRKEQENEEMLVSYSDLELDRDQWMYSTSEGR